MMKIQDAIIGHAVGDAMGVPVEFMDREDLDIKPVVDMRSYGSHNQPKGTWSDDTSLTLCLMDSLVDGFSLKTTAEKFVAWKNEEIWTPWGSVFDIGVTTTRAIYRLTNTLNAKAEDDFKFFKIGASEMDNGNGALMRSIPLYFHCKETGIEQSFDQIWESSALTHGHIRSALACLFYLILFDELSKTNDKLLAYSNSKNRFEIFVKEKEISQNETKLFDPIIRANIYELSRDEIKSSAYVMNTLEASLWSFLNSNSYKETVLTAVNLGNDTDTVGAIAGGLAGYHYGLDEIPKEWIKPLPKLYNIEVLCDLFEQSISERNLK